MLSILEEFVRGNISPEPRFYNPGSSYGRIMEALVECENKLESALNEEAKELFEKFNKSQIEMEILTGINKFIYGYRLGVLMATQAFNSKIDF